MAAAEARALWQRTANRCFIQEDAKRAPKFACNPPASSLLSKPSDATKGASDLHHFKHESSCSNLAPDTRWWLQTQPNYIHQMGLTKDKVNDLDTRNPQFVENESVSMKQDLVETLEVMNSSVGERSYEFVEMDCVSKETDEFCLGSEFPHWMGNEKSHELPWWRATDKDDLASFVARRSIGFIENCDLPRPLNASFKRDSCAHDGCLRENDRIREPKRGRCHNSTAVDAKQNSISGVEISDDSPIPETDLTKAKLLEALRRSQTRAREAETAAKQANVEKEHAVSLVFKQASQLFAYRQWLYVLQLENLYTQIKKAKSHPVSAAFPWRRPPQKARRTHRSRSQTKEPARARCSACAGAILALGLGLVGAGLLLGWTVGWMLV